MEHGVLSPEVFGRRALSPVEMLDSERARDAARQ